ncbi:MAG: hypothetical protein JWM72_1026 [Actinomycetia bacterium]|jgi:hypothetical protein|nr:hypothetical protein [Actinomycetes bacterium]MDQ1462296.1 hypothetical protein [Actinomycetota bacterium]
MTQHLKGLRTRDDREMPIPGAYTIDPAHSKIEFIGR